MSDPSPISVRSMTGQGHASSDTAIGSLTIEIRTVNHRGFKSTLRLPDALAQIESKIESSMRERIRRGSVNLCATLTQAAEDLPVTVNHHVLTRYLNQCQAAIEKSRFGAESNIVRMDVGSLLELPGVVSVDRQRTDNIEETWSEVESVLSMALANLVEMRQAEGVQMAETLLGECRTIGGHIETIRELAPLAAENYRNRLEGKVKRLLADHDVEVAAVDLLREVQIYADRADVSEEITRLDSHLTLFRGVLGGDGESGSDEPTGRKLDFIIQEMFRETNTIGSKAAHTDISANVVEIKCAIERMRELVQNLE